MSSWLNENSGINSKSKTRFFIFKYIKIEIFKRTGSIHKLQRAMGHSRLNVSLTYLRGLEVAELEESDMPMIL